MQHIKDTEVTIKEYTQNCLRDITDNRRMIRSSQSDIQNHGKRLQDVETELRDSKIMNSKHDGQIEKAIVDIETIKNNKAEQLTFELFLERTAEQIKQISEYTEINRNMVHGCENYLEKYLPLFN